jgi:hypothetical protein
MTQPRKKTRPRRAAAPSIAKEVQSRLSYYGTMAGSVAAISLVLWGIPEYIIPWSVRQWSTDPAPLEGREQHARDLAAEVKARQVSDHAHDLSQHQITQQLDATAQTLASVVTKQQQDYKEALTGRLERYQSALVTAKAQYGQSPTEDNKKIVEAGEAQLKEVQRQVMELK